MTRAAYEKEVRGGDRLPYLAHVDDHTVMLQDKVLMQTIVLKGLLFETSDTSELNYRKDLRDAAFKALSASRFALYYHIVRRRVEPALNASYDDAFSRSLNERWYRRLDTKALYVNDIYVTLLRRPTQGGKGVMQRLIEGMSSDAGRADGDLREALRDLNEAREILIASLAAYRPRTLGVYMRDDQHYSGILEFLAQTYNGFSQPRLLPEGSLASHVPTRRLSFGRNIGELAPYAEQDRRYFGILSIKDYPGTSRPGMLDELLRLPAEFVLTQSFAFVDRDPALRRVNLALRRMRASDDEAVTLRNELTGASDDLAAGRAVFGEHHMTLMLSASDEKDVAQGLADAQAVLADIGIVGVREDLALEPAFWAQFPGNMRFISRRALIAGRNFASFASFHNFAIGEPQGYWGEAVTVLETTAAGPYFFNFHHGDLGNFSVIGPSGSGKTVVLNFLLAQALKFRPRLVFFDKDRGSEIFIRAVGGRYRTLRPGETSGLNPLALEETPANRRFLIEWISRLVSPDAVPSAEELMVIEAAIDANFAAPPNLQRLRAFADLLRGAERPSASDLYARLRPWFGNGEHAWLFDNAEDQVGLEAAVVGFDMTQLLDSPTTRTPAMMYLFHRVEERLDGSPAIIVVDEGWKALDDDIFVARIRDWEKTIRKRNGLVGFVTQSAQDALASRISSAIVEQAATHIFLPNARAQAADYVDGFGLSQHEFDLIRSLPDHAHCFLVKHARESVVARLDLTGEAELLHVLSGRESAIRRLDEVRADVGDDPNDWMPVFLERLR
ncbi:MAG: VirB4 family type IV secretion/conjugal transfer ATPase [Asticcacaulis sp.]|uniref:VirB4 family type IV secretion/conjugal transfer ATPase n=1 Tax=Asticcacaulis sp. TaxID=1872648 RepID=UPI003F7BC6AE